MRLAAVLLLASCAHARISPDHATGPDGEADGAEALELRRSAYRGDGDVSYRAGDRVDWRRLTLPGGDAFDLDVTLTWHPKHADDRLGVIVYDEAGRELADEHTARRDGHVRELTVHVAGASGTLYFLVYARKRRDAARFSLAVTARPWRVKEFADAWLLVPDPPPLAPVPSTCVTAPYEYDPTHTSCNPPPPTVPPCPDPTDPSTPDCR